MMVWRVFEFLRLLADRPDLLARLRLLQKVDVLAFASENGFAFTEAEFDETIWQAEIAIAARIDEPFDFSCSVWETMWGKHYLDYLVQNVSGVMRRDMLAPSPSAKASDRPAPSLET